MSPHQIRRCPDPSFPWPEGGKESLTALFDILDEIGRACLAVIEKELDLAGLMDLVDAPGCPSWHHETILPDGKKSANEGGFAHAGASVMRVYQYWRPAGSTLPGLR